VRKAEGLEEKDRAEPRKGTKEGTKGGSPAAALEDSRYGTSTAMRRMERTAVT
jgi:hypothetical protein